MSNIKTHGKYDIHIEGSRTKLEKPLHNDSVPSFAGLASKLATIPDAPGADKNYKLQLAYTTANGFADLKWVEDT